MDETQKQAMDVKPNCTKLQKALPYCFLVLTVFCLSFIFFNTLHPLVIFDTDDWCYLTYPREALPIPGEWNPTRIFPEVLMPIAASFAGYVLTPAMGGDFIDAMIVTNALVAALFIAVYVLSFSLFIQRRCKLKAAWAVLLGGMFFLLHFLALRGLPSDNMHLFWSVNVTSFYFYTLPSIFCAILVLYAMSNNVLDAFFKPEHLVKKSFLVLAFYLALFSNLFSSIIVGAYVGSVLVFRLCGAVKAGFDLKSFCSENAAYIILIVVWVLVQLLEVMGGRASTLLNDVPFGELILQTLNALSGLAVKKLFIVLCIGAVLLYVFAVCKKPSASKHETRLQSAISPKQTVPMVLLVFFAAVLAFVYIVLICAKANPSYAGRADVVFPVFFFVTLASIACLAIAMQRFPLIDLVIPLLILVIVFSINTNGSTFKESNSANIPQEVARQVSQDLINQIEKANEAEQTSMELLVPQSILPDNWPFSLYAGPQDYFSRTMLKMGLVDHNINITLVPDKAKNDELGLTGFEYYPE